MAKSLDSVLGHCIVRALVYEHGGEDKFRAFAERMTQWQALRETAKVTPKAMRVATFIVFWAISMRETRQDSYSITEYQRYWNENERQAYRLQNEFRELWPGFETPDELGRQIVRQVDARIARRNVAKLPLTLQVEA